MLDVAMGGSTNTVLHTLAIAREAGIPYDIKRIDDISRRIPCVCKVSPSSNYHVQDVHRAGGIHTILGELKRMGVLHTACQTVTGKTLGENIDEWDVRSEKCTAWAKSVRVSGASALVVDPNDKLGSAARTPGGNLVPKPLLFFPADPRSITLWRLAAAFNAGDAAAAAALFSADAEFEVNEQLTWKGTAAIQEGLQGKFVEFKGLVRAELGQLKGTPVLLIWQYGKGEEKKLACLLRTGRLRGWEISKAYHEYRPAQLRIVSAPKKPPTPQTAASRSSTASWPPKAAS
jgi:dihydroxy-acid dehydratase